MSREPPGERRHTAQPQERGGRRDGGADRAVEEEEPDRDQELDADHDRRAVPERNGLPPGAEDVPEADDLRRVGELLAHPPSGVRSPRRPSGRNTRIRIRIENTIDCVQSEPGMCQGSPSFHVWMRPISTAPSTAPGRLPIPPSTAAVNAIRPSWKPWSKRTVVTYSE